MAAFDENPGVLDYLSFMGPMSPVVGQDRRMTDKIYSNIDGVLESPAGKDVVDGIKEIPGVGEVAKYALGAYKIGEGVHKSGIVENARGLGPSLVSPFLGMFD